MKMLAFNEETKWRLLICFFGFTIGVAFVMGILIYHLQKVNSILTLQTAFDNVERRMGWTEDYLRVLEKRVFSHEQDFHIAREELIQEAISDFQEYLSGIVEAQ